MLRECSYVRWNAYDSMGAPLCPDNSTHRLSAKVQKVSISEQRGPHPTPKGSISNADVTRDNIGVFPQDEQRRGERHTHVLCLEGIVGVRGRRWTRSAQRIQAAPE